MLDRSYKLQKVLLFHISSFLLLADSSHESINLFITTADQWYGPITTIHSHGHILKHIPWTAFTITGNDWERVKEVSEILAVRFTHLDCTITKTDMKCSNIIILAILLCREAAHTLAGSSGNRRAPNSGENKCENPRLQNIVMPSMMAL